LVIISYKTIREYTEQHRNVEDQLNNWYTISEKSDWANFNEMRQMFNSVDAVGNDLYVLIYIKFIGTHKEYDKLDLDSL
jgi:mRNA interferase HigB